MCCLIYMMDHNNEYENVTKAYSEVVMKPDEKICFHDV